MAGGARLAAGRFLAPRGTIPREVALMTELGMSSRDALTAARPAASAYLGAGGLRVGAAADVVTYIRDPREDPGTLARPAAVVSRGVRLV